MVRNYETVFILTPVLSDVQVKEAVKRYKTFLTDNGAEMVSEENWGLKKLAYPIQKKSTGFYQLFQFKADPQLIQKFEIEFKRDEKVIRFLTFHMDKYAVAYAEKRRNRLSEKKEA
jgi:small subunit ribosomal protein S6